MKKLLTELRAQFSLREWTLAIFCYMPTSHGVKPKAGARLTQPGHNAEAIHSALVLLKFNLKNQ